LPSLRSSLVRLVLAAAVASPALTPFAQGPANAAYGDAAISKDVVTVPMTFPVLGATSYVDTFLACRAGCSRPHFGQDLMGPKMRPLVAAFSGVVGSIKRESRVGEGNYITVRGDNGWSANYIHVNNDSPGTDDGRGTAKYAFAEDMYVGKRVFAGQLLGWSGDSGNAESTGPHLHFELRRGDSWSGTVYNAFSSLNHATRLRAPAVAGPHPGSVYVKACALCPVYHVENGTTKRYLRKEVAQAIAWDSRTAVTVTAAEVAWYAKGPDVELPAGRAYRHPDESIWFVNNHVRTYVPTREALAALGIPMARVRTMTPAGLGTLRIDNAAALPTAPTYDGALLRSPDGLSLWVMGGGERHLVPDADTQRSWNLILADAITLTPEQLLLPEFPAVGAPLLMKDGTFVKDGIGGIWLVTKGTRRRFPSWTLYARYGYTPVHTLALPADTIRRIPVGALMLP
jgi:murein DD-endopeptidase MepM/ murein hydrolase activator NlpD